MTAMTGTSFSRRCAKLLEIGNNGLIVRSELQIDRPGCERFLAEFLIAPKLMTFEPKYLLHVKTTVEVFGNLKAKTGAVHLYSKEKVNSAAKKILSEWRMRGPGDESPFSFLAPTPSVAILKSGDAAALIPPESPFQQFYLAVTAANLDATFRSWRDGARPRNAEQFKLEEATHLLTDRLGAYVCQSRERVLRQLIL